MPAKSKPRIIGMRLSLAHRGFHVRALLLEPAHELLERRVRQNPVELRAIIVDEADVLDHDVVGFPVAAHLVQFVSDRDFFALRRDRLGEHLGVVAVDLLARVPDLFALGRFDLLGVRVLEQAGEDPDELLLLLGRDTTRSEERRAGKECRSRWPPYHSKKKTQTAATTRRSREPTPRPGASSLSLASS